MRRGLCDEAIRLASLLDVAMPDEAEVLGLLALLELQASRHATRVDDEGRLVLLEDQDRSRWDRVQIERADRHLQHAREAGALGPYGLQALIAECHARAPSVEETDWERIVCCYQALERLTASPVVTLNRAVAVAMTEGLPAALAIVDSLSDDRRMRDYPHLPATRADLLRRLGRRDEAAREYRHAIGLTHNDAERSFLELRLAECSDSGASER